MRLLHTSDWHLGASLHGRKRYEESQKFLDWLILTVKEQEVDLLLVAGDVFDSSAPGSRAQEMYYRFLGAVARSGCRYVVVVAGNHDSPSFIAAPKDVLAYLSIHVIGSVPKDPEDLVIPVQDGNSRVRAILCAVPFLREKDLLPPGTGLAMDRRTSLLADGIREYYHKIGAIAEEERGRAGQSVPIIGTGHLFAAGCETRTGDGVRECYVGRSALVGTDVFPSCFSYLALGHLHVPQVVGRNGFVRYSGSPIPVGFSEITHQKKVIILELDDTGDITLEEHPVPVFQKFASLKGTKSEIQAEVNALDRSGESVLAEVAVDSHDPPSTLQNWVADLLRGTAIECLKLTSTNTSGAVLTPHGEGESLQDLSEKEVFLRRLAGESFGEEEAAALTTAFEEILLEYRQRDTLDR